jgi:hypothetical protein
MEVKRTDSYYVHYKTKFDVVGCIVSVFRGYEANNKCEVMIRVRRLSRFNTSLLE